MNFAVFFLLSALLTIIFIDKFVYLCCCDCCCCNNTQMMNVSGTMVPMNTGGCGCDCCCGGGGSDSTALLLALLGKKRRKRQLTFPLPVSENNGKMFCENGKCTPARNITTIRGRRVPIQKSLSYFNGAQNLKKNNFNQQIPKNIPNFQQYSFINRNNIH
uniref:Secreted protein n=1 Tax=Meloidogyne hapla TaxID=6305 RepID=A0A1I8BJX8_MELHA